MSRANLDLCKLDSHGEGYEEEHSYAIWWTHYESGASKERSYGGIDSLAMTQSTMLPISNYKQGLLLRFPLSMVVRRLVL